MNIKDPIVYKNVTYYDLSAYQVEGTVYRKHIIAFKCCLETSVFVDSRTISLNIQEIIAF